MNRIFSLLLAALPFATVSAEDINALQINMASGKSVVMLLDEQPLVTFKDNDIVITTLLNEVRYASADVQKFTYTTVETEGIHGARLDNTYVSFTATGFTLSHLDPLSEVFIYAADGALLSISKTDASGNATVTFPTQQGAVYIVKTSIATFKITKP